MSRQHLILILVVLIAVLACVPAAGAGETRGASVTLFAERDLKGPYVTMRPSKDRLRAASLENTVRDKVSSIRATVPAKMELHLMDAGRSRLVLRAGSHVIRDLGKKRLDNVIDAVLWRVPPNAPTIPPPGSGGPTGPFVGVLKKKVYADPRLTGSVTPSTPVRSRDDDGGTSRTRPAQRTG